MRLNCTVVPFLSFFLLLLFSFSSQLDQACGFQQQHKQQQQQNVVANHHRRQTSSSSSSSSSLSATTTTTNKTRRRVAVQEATTRSRDPSSSSSSPDDDLRVVEEIHGDDDDDNESSVLLFLLLSKKIKSYCSQEDQALIQRAFQVSQMAHTEEPSSNNNNNNTPKKNKNNKKWKHTVGLTNILADMKLDAASLVTGLLYSACIIDDDNNDNGNDDDEESTTTTTIRGISIQEIQKEFGPVIGRLVQGTRTIDNTIIKFRATTTTTQSDHHTTKMVAENYRKMIVAMAHDIRVILVCLADRTQTIRSFSMIASSENDDQDTNNYNNKNNNKELLQRQMDIAGETITLFAPLAHRLGLYNLKTELEDTSFQFWKPDEYRQLRQLVAARQEQRQTYTDNVIRILTQRLQEEEDENDDSSTTTTTITVTGRAKSFFSIYQKMQSQNKAFDDIQDLSAFRILVDNVGQCYQALSVVTTNWEPVPGRFKDYIASPKPNGYQSLHSTVIGPEGKRIEVQIRTREMHEIAEGGVAAHWMYKGSAGGKGKGGKDDDEARRYAWLRQLVEWIQTDDDDNISSSDDNSDGAKHLAPGKKETHKKETGLFEEDVFVFSPQGQLYSVAKGSSVLDFAYRIHSDLGNHCVGARVNDRMVSLKYELQNGETIEIMKSTTQTPRQEWLNIVKTSKARSRIKAWLNKERMGDESVARGRELLEKAIKKYTAAKQQHNNGSNGSTTASADGGMKAYKEKLDALLSTFKFQDEPELLTALSLGQISISSVVHEIFSTPRQTIRSLALDETGDELVLMTIKKENEAKTRRPKKPKSDGLVVGGKRNMLINFCRNCNALYGEDVKGVVTKGRGVKVHRIGCKYLLESDEDRRVDAVWDVAAKSALRATEVEVLCEDAPGMLASMSKVVSACKVNIGSVSLRKLSDGRGLARFGLLLSSIDDLNSVTTQLMQEKGVLGVKRK